MAKTLEHLYCNIFLNQIMSQKVHQLSVKVRAAVVGWKGNSNQIGCVSQNNVNNQRKKESQMDT